MRICKMGVDCMRAVLLSLLLLCMLIPRLAFAQEGGPEPIYQTLNELEGKRIAYITGSVYDQRVNAKVANTKSQYYPSLTDCVTAVENDKADAAVQVSYCCELLVNRRGGTVAMLPEYVDPVQEAFFFKYGNPLKDDFNKVIAKFYEDGTIDKLSAKWVNSDNANKTLPTQDWDAPNGTLKFATVGVAEPFSYVGEGGQILGYDVDLALLIAKELGYHLDVFTIPVDSIVASVQTGKADIGGTVTRTDERAKAVDFSEQVMPAYISVVVKAKEGSAAASSDGFAQKIMASFQKTFIEGNRWQLILAGLGATALISILSGLFGTILGFFTVLARYSKIKWLNRVVNAYSVLMGRIPLVVFLLVLYYVVFGSMDVPGELVAIIGFTLAFGAVAGSTMWSAVSGIDAIQEETGLALGYERNQVFWKIIFPHAARLFMPQLLGQFVSLVKDTSIVGFISVQDLTRAMDLIRASTMEAFFPLITLAVIYFFVCWLLALVLERATARMSYERAPRKVRGVVERW